MSNKEVLENSASIVKWVKVLGYMSVASSIISAVIFALATSLQAYLVKETKKVAAVPAGHFWEFPLVHWVNSPDYYDETAKPLSVADKYIRAMYEIDTTNFYTAGTGKSGDFRLSKKLQELLYYTVPTSPEYVKVSERLANSAAEFDKFKECRCSRRFLIDDMWIQQNPTSFLTIRAMGRFVMLPHDATRKLEIELLGYKSIALQLSQDLPMLLLEGIAGPNPQPLNPEGWYVMQSEIENVTKEEMEAIRKVRALAALKLGY
jgi:hypothetical protein